MTLVYIHGASATSDSFNYIRSKLGNGIDINYDSRNGFENNLAEIMEQLKDVKDMAFVAHSLGGIYFIAYCQCYAYAGQRCSYSKYALWRS